MIMFNCYLYPAFNLHISNRIEVAEYYAPSFRKMENTYQAVRKKVGTDSFLKIVADQYITADSEDMFNASIALTDYIGIAEKYLSHEVKPEQTITLYLASADRHLPENVDIVYQANGMVIFRFVKSS